MSAPSRPYKGNNALQRNSSTPRRWQLAMRDDEKSDSGVTDRGVIKERLANVNAGTIFFRNKIRSAMQEIYRSQVAHRRRIESDFETSLAEIGMYRAKHRRVILVIDALNSKERSARQLFIDEEAHFREWYVDRSVAVLRDEFKHRVNIQRAFAVENIEIHCAEITKRGLLTVTAREFSNRLGIAAAQEAAISALHDRFQYMAESCRYFTTAFAHLREECALIGRNVIAEEEGERDALANAFHTMHESVVAFETSKFSVQQREVTSRDRIHMENEQRIFAIGQDFLRAKLGILEKKKEIRDSRADFVEQVENYHADIIKEEENERTALRALKETEKRRIEGFLHAAHHLLNAQLGIVQAEKDAFFVIAVQKTQVQVDSLWEEYRQTLRSLAGRKALREKHFGEVQALFSCEELSRHGISASEAVEWDKKAECFRERTMALWSSLEMFAHQRNAVFEGWHAVAKQTYDAQLVLHRDLCKLHTDRVAIELGHLKAFEETQSGEESVRNALMHMERTAKGALFVSSAVVELETFESYARNALSINQWRSLSDLHASFLSTRTHIFLGRLECAEAEERGKIEGDFLIDFKMFYLSMPRGEDTELSESGNAVSEVREFMGQIESANVLAFLEKEIAVQSAEVNAMSIEQMAAVARLLEALGAEEFRTFEECEQIERDGDAWSKKQQRKHESAQMLTEEVLQARKALAKHESTRAASVAQAKKARQQNEEKRAMTKNRLRVAEEEVRKAVESLESTRDRVRELMQAQPISPAAKRGKRY